MEYHRMNDNKDYNTNSPTWLNVLFFIGFLAATGLSCFYTFQYFDGQIDDKYTIAWWTHVSTGLLLETIKNAGYFGFFHYILTRNFPVALACFCLAAFGTAVSLLATQAFIKSNKSHSVEHALKQAKLTSPTYQGLLKQLRDSQKRSKGFTNLAKRGQYSKYHNRQDQAKDTLLLSGSESNKQSLIIRQLDDWESRFRSKYKQSHHSFFETMAKLVTAGHYSDNESGQIIWAGMIEAGSIIFLWLYMVGIRTKSETTLLQKCADYIKQRFPRAGDLHSVNPDGTVTNLNTGHTLENNDIDNLTDKFSDKNSGQFIGKNTTEKPENFITPNTDKISDNLSVEQNSQVTDLESEKPIKSVIKSEKKKSENTDKLTDKIGDKFTDKTADKFGGNLPVNLSDDEIKLLSLDDRKLVARRMILNEQMKPQITPLIKRIGMHQSTAQDLLVELSTGKEAIIKRVKAAKNCRYELRKKGKK